MSDGFFNYVHTTFTALSEKLEYFMENYTPSNLTISGNTILGSESCGGNVSGNVTVYAPTTFHGNVEASHMTVDRLRVLDSTCIGETRCDRLNVNSNTIFNNDVTFGHCSDVVFNGSFNVVSNAVFGNNVNNTVDVNGSLHSQHLVVAGNTVLGTHHCGGNNYGDNGTLTVYAPATFTGNVESRNMRINNLTVVDSTVIGQCSSDDLTINSNTVFGQNGSVRFDGDFHVVSNSVFGTDNTNTVVATGSVQAKNLKVPLADTNSLMFGATPIITYVEKNANFDLHTELPDSVIVIIKNTSANGISITYSWGNYDVVGSGETVTYLKVSHCAFNRIFGNVIVD